MDVKEAGATLDALISSFNARVAELQQLVIARNMYPASSISDLSSIDAALKGMEIQVQNIKNRLRDENRSIPKARKLIEAALQQQKKLESISACVPACMPQIVANLNQDHNKWEQREDHKQDLELESLKVEEPAPKEKKGRASPPMWYITSDELNSVPSYMKQRLTLDKMNAAIGDMATYAEANAQLIAAPRKKLSDNNLDKALELREIAMTDGVKGKHFFLESDIKGPSMKLDNTGKALLTVGFLTDLVKIKVSQTMLSSLGSIGIVSSFIITTWSPSTSGPDKRDQNWASPCNHPIEALVNSSS